MSSTEPYAYEARDFIVKRLEALGLRDAAAQFAALEPVEEIWDRRIWVPREAHEWRAEREDLPLRGQTPTHPGLTARGGALTEKEIPWRQPKP